MTTDLSAGIIPVRNNLHVSAQQDSEKIKHLQELNIVKCSSKVLMICSDLFTLDAEIVQEKGNANIIL